jgi:hypothetical protein
LRITPTTHGEEEIFEISDDERESVEVECDSSHGDRVSDEELVHHGAHKLEREDAAQLDSGAAEEEFFFVWGGRERGLTSDVV